MHLNIHKIGFITMGNDVFDSKRIKSCSGGKFRWRSLCLVLIAMMCLSGCKNTNLSAGEWHVTRNSHRIKTFVKDWCITQEADCFYRDNMNLGGKCTALITLECDGNSIQNAYIEFYNDVSILESIFKRGEEVDVRVVNMYGYGEFRFDLDTEAFDEACKLIPVG